MGNKSYSINLGQIADVPLSLSGDLPNMAEVSFWFPCGTTKTKRYPQQKDTPQCPVRRLARNNLPFPQLAVDGSPVVAALDVHLPVS